MKDALEDLGRTVEAAAKRLRGMTETEAEARPAPGAWSAKETVGHLIDRRRTVTRNEGRITSPGK
ncbi:MAG: DinB family protein [Acidobacteria bacterium]|nr:DinB family protein [Acidobacteriota bacterium]